MNHSPNDKNGVSSLSGDCAKASCVCESVFFSHQGEVIIHAHQLIYAVLFQHHDPCQTGVPNPSAVLTVNHVSLPATVLTGHEQQVKDLQLFKHAHTQPHTCEVDAMCHEGTLFVDIDDVTHIAFVAVVRWLVLHPALIADLLPCRHQLVPQNLNLFDGLKETMSEEKEGENSKAHLCSDVDEYRLFKQRRVS